MVDTAHAVPNLERRWARYELGLLVLRQMTRPMDWWAVKRSQRLYDVLVGFGVSEDEIVRVVGIE